MNMSENERHKIKTNIKERFEQDTLFFDNRIKFLCEIIQRKLEKINQKGSGINLAVKFDYINIKNDYMKLKQYL